MNSASWKYAHDSQIILDGTFGVCDSRVLLFIVMAVDENRKGVPIAFLLFSAPTGNKQSSSGYNTSIIAKLLGKWKESLNKCAATYGRAGIIFDPRCAITDTDLKERGGLLIVFPDIWLLICRFHLRQSWRNHRNKLLKGKSQVLVDLKNRMTRLERSLTATQEISDARALLAAERQVLEQLSADHPRATQKAIQHIDYLDSYWTTDNLWQSWSDYGRTFAASLLGCGLDGVIPTTNHLESFNGVLKCSHLRRWQNGGRRLRIDVLIHALVMYILPSIFEERRMYIEQNNRRATQIRLLPGGAALLGQQNQKILPSAIPKIAYLVPDAECDSRGRELVMNRQISTPTPMPDNAGLTLTSFSSQALSIDIDPVTYTIRIGFNGAVSCQCPDFQDRGGACKHIRGAFIILDDLRQRGINIPFIPVPRSPAEAHAVQARVILTITTRPKKSELPTSRAAEKIEDILRADTSCLETEDDDDDEALEDDDISVATDASSDSDSDSESESSTMPQPRMTQSKAALTEQVLARALYELREVGSKFSDIGDILQHAEITNLNDDQRAQIGHGSGQVRHFLTQLQNLLDLPANSHPSAPSQASAGSSSLKRTAATAQLLPPSPEKAQKRHESYAPH
ncbi:hypothetical protein C8J57DRAFT_1537513 [Mycena rebaudengoi]|nr:hypothetical protein C8J57DRAFT_1537513 [Mycena rebaudengoi]